MILESVNLNDVVVLILGLATAFIVWKSGLLQQIIKSSNELLKLRTTERDDALREKEMWKNKYEELEDDFRSLRRELIQRVEISHEDKDEIKRLKSMLQEKINEKTLDGR